MRKHAASWMQVFTRASRLTAATALLLCLGTGMAIAASNPAKPTYGAPYFSKGWQSSQPCQDGTSIYKNDGPPEAIIDDAVDDLEHDITGCLGSCSFTVGPTDPTRPYPYIVAAVTLGNGCSGTLDVSGTILPRDDGAGGPHNPGEGQSADDSVPDVGDPMNAASGNKFITENDYTGTPGLEFRRMYNSDVNGITKSSLGLKWSHTYNRFLTILGTPASSIVAVRPDGSHETFKNSGSSWASTDSAADTLVESHDAQGHVTAYALFVGPTRRTETYGPTGQLLSISDQTGQGVTLAYSTASTPTSIAPKPGLLLTVTDSKQRQLGFSYDSNGYLTTLTLPDKQVIQYTTSSVLSSVKYPGAPYARGYDYDEYDFSSSGGYTLLTGIYDETGTRYSSMSYDSSQRATGTTFGGSALSMSGGVNLTTIAYNADSTSTVTSPLGHGAVISFSQYNGASLIGSYDQPCGPDCGQRYQTRTYDANGYPASTSDFKGVQTVTTYDAYGDLTEEVDASGTASQRTINTAWDTALRVPTSRTTLDSTGHAVTKSAWVYNALAEPIAKCEIDPALAGSYVCAATGTAPAGVRRWTYTYCTALGSGCPIVGLLLTVTGPRTDLVQATNYTYYTTSSAVNCGTPGGACYQAGDLHTVKDASGHVTTIASYDAGGRPTRITDANGINTDSTYTWRGQLATRAIEGATTTFMYTPFGAVASVTDADGVTMTYGYDAAHRLTSITDGFGDHIYYGLDNAGNVVQEAVTSPSRTQVKGLSRTFNTLGQLTTVVDGLSNTIFHADTALSYDPNSDLVLSTDANGIQHQRGLDPLRRLVSTIQNYGGTDAATKNTSTTIAYDATNRVVGVTDPGSLNTLYTFDGLGNRTSLQSPDTGTSNDTFDVAGNRLTHKDAKGVVGTFAYDALNRRISLTYVDTTLNAAYKYDEANSVTGCATSSPIGHLTRIVENAVTTTYCYDVRGNVIQKKQLQGTITDVTSYDYTAANRLASMVTPDLTSVTYTRDVVGNITTIQAAPAAGTSAMVVSAATYLPFGPVASYKLGSGQVVTRTYDANYTVTDVVSPALALHFAHDSMGNISATGNASGASPATETYSYDPLYRLTAVTDGTTAVEAFTYNQTGDRLAKSGTGLATGAYTYTSGTHQLNATGTAARTNDVNGSTTATTVAGQIYGFGYNGRGRLTVAQASGQTIGTYTYNALGQRVLKVATLPQAITQRYAYDENNRLIGEYTTTTKRDTIWMNEVPVAVVDVSGTTSTESYIHADALGTPRAVTNSAGTTIWTWAYKGDPFGESLPASTGGFTLNLRYPGQYYDAESGTNYNMFRTYEPATGRYLQSDRIGLKGGISTYGYVSGNPLVHFDVFGLDGDVGFGGSFGGGGASGSWESPTNCTASNTLPTVPNLFGTLPEVPRLYGGSWAAGAGTAAGAAAPSLWSAGLNGGDSSVFWSGYQYGARDIAESLGGTTLESTPIGSALDYLSNTVGVPNLGPVWNAASATFAGNAYGTARAVILAPGYTWTNIEAPILTANEVEILLIGL